MTRTDNINQVKIVIASKEIEMCIYKSKTRTSSPMPK